MFSVADMKSRTSSSFPSSDHEQVCRSWEGAQPGPSWPTETFRTIGIMLSLRMEVGWWAGNYISFSFL